MIAELVLAAERRTVRSVLAAASDAQQGHVQMPASIGRRELLGLTGDWSHGLRGPHAGAGALRLRRRAMACWFELLVPADERTAAAAAMSALDEVERVEALLSIYRPESELSRLNHALADPRTAAAGVTVSAELWPFLVLCRSAWQESGGAFDPGTGELSAVWGFRDRRPRHPSNAEIERALARGGLGRLRLEAGARRVSADAPGVVLNPGAVGKGWALDRAIDALRAAGVSNALLSAGGSSIRAIGGGPDGDGWPVSVPAPSAPRVLRLRDAALGTTGGLEQFFEHDGRRYAHVIDPRRGVAVQRAGLVSVVVREPPPSDRAREGTTPPDVRGHEAAWADALSTALFVMGRDESLRWLARNPWVDAAGGESPQAAPE